MSLLQSSGASFSIEVKNKTKQNKTKQNKTKKNKQTKNKQKTNKQTNKQTNKKTIEQHGLRQRSIQIHTVFTKIFRKKITPYHTSTNICTCSLDFIGKHFKQWWWIIKSADPDLIPCSIAFDLGLFAQAGLCEYLGYIRYFTLFNLGFSKLSFIISLLELSQTFLLSR